MENKPVSFGRFPSRKLFIENIVRNASKLSEFVCHAFEL